MLQLGGGTFDASRLDVASTTTILGYGVVKPAVGATGLLNAVGGGTLALLGTVGSAAGLRADANSVLQLNQTPLTSVTGNVTLNAVGSKIQFGTTTFTALESTLTGIAATGTLSVLGGRGYVTTKAITDGGVLTVAGGTITAASITVASTGRIIGSGTFTNAIASTGTIESSAGLLKLNAGASGTGTLLVDAGSTLELAASTSVGTITANGVLQLDGQTYSASTTVGATGLVQGFGTMSASIVDNGVIDAKGGVLKLASSVSGAGGLRIENASTLELGGATSRGVTFATGAVGTLQLDAQTSFTGAVGGLALGDAINFKNETVNSAVVSGTTLTVVGSAGTTTYQVAGALSGNHFAVQADQHTIKLVAGALRLAPASFLASPSAPAPAPDFPAEEARPTPVAAAGFVPEAPPGTPGVWAYRPSVEQILFVHH